MSHPNVTTLFEAGSHEGRIYLVFEFLKGKAGGLLGSGIKWNFTKFLVAPDGKVTARFEPKTDPLDQKVTERLAAVLPSYMVPARFEAVQVLPV